MNGGFGPLKQTLIYCTVHPVVPLGLTFLILFSLVSKIILFNTNRNWKKTGSFLLHYLSQYLYVNFLYGFSGPVPGHGVLLKKSDPVSKLQ